MASPFKVMQTISTGAPVALTAGVYSVGSDLLLNRTRWAPTTKGWVAGGVGLAGAALASGYAPRIAVGLLAGGVVNVSQALSRQYRLEQRIDELLSEKRAAAAAGTTGTTTGGATTPAQTTQPATGLPAGRYASSGYVTASGQHVRVGR